MNEPQPPTSDYERLLREFRASAGPLEVLASQISDGIEMEALAMSPGGKLLIEHSLLAAKRCLESILDPNINEHELKNAVIELRVQHRVLDIIGAHIGLGRKASREIVHAESLNPPAENPDEPEHDPDDAPID